MDHLEAAALISGASRAENRKVSQPTNVHLVTMEAVAASADGTVLVDPGGDVFTPDESQYVEIETVGSIAEGDEVTVLLTGEPGGSMDVLSLGPIGEGDRQNEAIADAAEAAQTAWEYADSAHDAADAAQQSADDAATAASSAQGSATRANTAANDALAQLDTVQDVLGVVQWVAEHGTFAKTTDTMLDPSKVYYVRTGSGTSADPYLYTAVGEPKQADIGSYYELTMDQALSQYVASHLALTDAGLYVLKDASGYRVLLSNTGMSVIDPQGHTVATYGESVTLDSSHPQSIGGEQAYIVYYDSDDDGAPDTIRIGGHVLMGGSKTLSDVLAELDEATAIDAVGRNLLRKTATIMAADVALARATVPEAGLIRVASTTTYGLAKFKVNYLDFADWGEGTYTVSFDAREVDDGSGYASGQNLRVYLGFSVPTRIGNAFSSSYDRYTYKYVALNDQWARYSFTYRVPDDLKSGQETALAAGSQLSVEFFRVAEYLPVEVRNVKLERGTKATAWTMAPEDLVGIVSTTVTYGTSASDAVEPVAWYATAPTVGAGQWLWTRTVTAYTDGTSTTSYSKSYAGTNGADGTSVTILGSYDTLAELEAAHPTGSTGDGYIVAGDLYVWDGNAWDDVGQIQGPQGQSGRDGTSVSVESSTKVDGVTTVTLSDGTVLTISDGTDGEDGKSGPDGRNLLLGTSEPKSATFTGATSNANTDYYGESDYGKTVTAGNTGDLFAVSFDWAVDVPEGGTAGGEAWVQIEGTIINGVVDAGGYGGSQGRRGIDLTPGSGHYWALFRITAAQAAFARQRMRLRARGTSDYPACPGSTVTISNLKFERTDTAPTGWSLAPEDLVGIGSTAIAYGTSTDATTEPTSWSTTPPTTIANGAWVWVRTTTTFTDGTETVTYSKSYVGTNGTDGRAGTDGRDGRDGTDGTGITSIVEQWYLSTSSTSQTGGAWSAEQPAWQAGRYIWQRSVVTWDTTPATTTETTPVLAKALTGANEGAAEAAKTATNYIQADSTGIRIASSNPATATTYQHQTATETEFVVDGTSMAEFGGSGARVGDEGGAHIVMDENGVVLNRYNTSTETIDELAAFGMGDYGARMLLDQLTLNCVDYNGTAGGTDSWADLEHTGGARVRLGYHIDGAAAEVQRRYSYIDPSADKLRLNGKLFDLSQLVSAIPVTLFTGNYSTTRASVVTLSESAENFSMLRIVCEDNDGQQASVDVYSPHGKNFSVTMSTATDAYMYVKSKSFYISGASIGCVSSNGVYRHGQARIGSDGTLYSQSAELIGIVRVIGFY